MNYKILLIAFLSISISTIYAQSPEAVRVLGNQGAESACNGTQDAGTINTINPVAGNSGSIISFTDTTFLCFGDSAIVDHNEDMQFDGDPNPATTPEIGYAFYACPPSIFGDELSSIQGDACVINDPPTTNGVYVARSIAPDNPDLILGNTGSLNAFFNNGNPTLIYFAPITVDAYSGMPIFENGGSCVNVGVDQAFPVVYLNELSTHTLTTAGLSGSFILQGGYPEFDPAAHYTISSIEKTNDPGVTAPIPPGDFGNGDRVPITVPEAGTYTITIEDRTNCPLSFEMAFNEDEVIFNIGDRDVLLGDNFCIPITVNNFDSIEGLQLTMTFDPTVISYNSFQSWALSTDVLFSVVEEGDQGVIKVLWNSNQIGIGESLPDGSTLIEFCFSTAPNAMVGDMTILNINRVGDFFLEVVDANGNERNIGVDPGKVTIISNDLTASATSCGSLPNESEGTLTINAFSGQAPYSIDITGPQSESGIIMSDGGSITFNNLPPGIYSIEVTDDNGQTFNLSQEVYDGGTEGLARPTFDLIGYDPSCFGGMNGRVVLDTSTGHIRRPLSIQWSTNEYNKDSIIQLARGNYFVTVTDAFGCEEIGSQSLAQTEIMLSANVTDASCSGYSDGSAIVSASGGTPISGGQYSFEWSSGASIGTDAVINNLSDGWHRITVTDDNNCSIVDSIFISASRRIVLNSLSRSEPQCNGDSNGSITIEAGTEGGSANTPYSITIYDEDAGGVPVGSQMGPDMASANGITAGAYRIVIEDNTMPNACELDTIIMLEQPDTISVDIDKKDVTCIGNGMDGTVTLDVNGGTPLAGGSYNYDWMGPVALANSNSHSILEPGLYTVTVEDANGCTNERSITIDSASIPELVSITSTTPTCPETCDGTITIRARSQSGYPIAEYTINKTGGSLDTLTSSTEITIGGFCGGDFFSVTSIEDEAGCVLNPGTFDVFPSRDSLTIDTPNTMVVNPSCGNNADGSIILSLQGAMQPYIVEWQGSPPDTISGTTDTLDNISAGTYNVTINDINNCGNLTLSFTLDAPQGLSATFSNQSPSGCFSSCDGGATVEAMGGTPAGGNYNFTWSSGFTDSGPTSTATDLCPGTQWVLIDDGSCADTFYVEIDGSDSISIDLENLQEPSCFGADDGSIEVIAMGGNGNLSYDWVGGPFTARWDGIEAGTYIIEITDESMCTASDTFQLGQPDSLNAYFEPADIMDPTCPGEEDGMLIVTVEGGNGSNSFTWTNSSSTSEEASGLNDGIYTVTVTDQNQCEDTARAELETAPPIQVNLPVPDTPACQGGIIQYLLTNNDVSGGNGGPYEYRVGNSPLTSLGTEVSTNSGSVILSIVDNQGCAFDTVLLLPVKDSIVVSLPPEVEIGLGDSALLMPEVQSNTEIIGYNWTPSSGLSCSDCINTIAAPARNTTYTFTVTDTNGCTASASVRVILNLRRNVYIPNVFTPNGDGINDVFSVYTGDEVLEITSLKVFDRWGNLMWEGRNLFPSSNGSVGWDGKHRGKLMGPGVYTYIAEILFVDQRVLVYQGDVTITSVR